MNEYRINSHISEFTSKDKAGKIFAKFNKLTTRMLRINLCKDDMAPEFGEEALQSTT